jgi:hypothetical protein
VIQSLRRRSRRFPSCPRIGGPIQRPDYATPRPVDRVEFGCVSRASKGQPAERGCGGRSPLLAKEWISVERQASPNQHCQQQAVCIHGLLLRPQLVESKSRIRSSGFRILNDRTDWSPVAATMNAGRAYRLAENLHSLDMLRAEDAARSDLLVRCILSAEREGLRRSLRSFPKPAPIRFASPSCSSLTSGSGFPFRERRRERIRRPTASAAVPPQTVMVWSRDGPTDTIEIFAPIRSCKALR